MLCAESHAARAAAEATAARARAGLDLALAETADARTLLARAMTVEQVQFWANLEGHWPHVIPVLVPAAVLRSQVRVSAGSGQGDSAEPAPAQAAGQRRRNRRPQHALQEHRLGRRAHSYRRRLTGASRFEIPPAGHLATFAEKKHASGAPPRAPLALWHHGASNPFLTTPPTAHVDVQC